MNNVFAFKGREAPWRRENASEETVLIGTRVIIIFHRATEFGLDVQNKLNRFRAGEDVEDVVEQQGAIPIPAAHLVEGGRAFLRLPAVKLCMLSRSARLSCVCQLSCQCPASEP